jgi:hypothetical protein
VLLVTSCVHAWATASHPMEDCAWGDDSSERNHKLAGLCCSPEVHHCGLKQVYQKLLQSTLGERITQAGLGVTLRVTVQAAPVPAALGGVRVVCSQPCPFVW